MDENSAVSAPRPPIASWRRLPAAEGLTVSRFLVVVAIFFLIGVLTQAGLWLGNAKDYVGVDPDDTMRLVEVRDLLGGQGWFDLQQYRLGVEGGTLMHWSRLIDWPIATLIRAFGSILGPQGAEAAALIVWPLLLILPLFAATALASYRLGGRSAMVIALILALAFLAAIVRFRPGAIDHHNVQLVLAVFIAAMLIDPLCRASNFAAAATAGALALAIGAETTPLVAAAAIAVAMLWALRGEAYRRAAIGFGMTFALVTGAVFIATTPARLWSSVTCDTLSLGFLVLAAAGGMMLAAAAMFLTSRGTAVRLGALAATGLVVLALAVAIAPQCLRSPLSDLDPLLQTYWISTISEAQSIVSELAVSPQGVGSLYAVGIIATMVSVMRISRGEQVLPHAVLLSLIVISWLVSAVQVRGMLFANYLAFIPLSALVADLRALYLARRKDLRAAAAFALSALFSVPSVWSVVGVLAMEPVNAIAGVDSRAAAAKADAGAKACVTAGSVASLARMPQGRMLASFNEAPALLRFTHHSVIGANYHRNQRGMIAAIRIGMDEPENALRRLEAEGIRYIVVCDGDPLVARIASDYPRGLFAALSSGEIPGYLDELVATPGARLRVYEVVRR